MPIHPDVPPPAGYPPKLIQALHGWAIFEIYDQATGQLLAYVVTDPEMTQEEVFDNLIEAQQYMQKRALTAGNDGGGSPLPS